MRTIGDANVVHGMNEKENGKAGARERERAEVDRNESRQRWNEKCSVKEIHNGYTKRKHKNKHQAKHTITIMHEDAVNLIKSYKTCCFFSHFAPFYRNLYF